MGAQISTRRLFILKIDSYDGSDTFLHCGDETRDHLYAIIAITEQGHAEIVDSSYRNLDEALEAWPEARP